MTSLTVRLSSEIEPRTVEFDGSSGLDLLAELGLPVDTVLLIRDGQPIADDEDLLDGNEIEVIIVSSGG